MPDRRPREATSEHTRILRVMLAVEDCVAYWQAPSIGLDDRDRIPTAFNDRWFGGKSEPRVKTLLGDMTLRFDAFPHALRAIREWKPPRHLAPWICHLHTQLADPIYRAFTGKFLPIRLNQGYASIDREAAARWVQETWPNRWSPATCLKFGANMLSAASEAGLLRDRKEPRKLTTPSPPQVAVEYALYALREIEIEAPLLDSPYICSLVPRLEDRTPCLNSLEHLRFEGMGRIGNLEWVYPDLATWARAQRDTTLEETA